MEFKRATEELAEQQRMEKQKMEMMFRELEEKQRMEKEQAQKKVDDIRAKWKARREAGDEPASSGQRAQVATEAEVIAAKQKFEDALREAQQEQHIREIEEEQRRQEIELKKHEDAADREERNKIIMAEIEAEQRRAMKAATDGTPTAKMTEGQRAACVSH
eukprot:423055-Pyramimonas_sp.AAC.1